MKTLKRLVLIAIAFSGIPFMASGLDRIIGYSGFLTNSAGSAAIANGSHSIVFSIYNAASGGTLLWTDTFSVTTLNGEFSVELGSHPAAPLNVNFSADTNYWLGVNVDSNGEMVPRKAFLMVPMSFRFLNIETRTTAQGDPGSPVTGQMWLMVP
jgi:hypothetical protein